MHIPLIVITWTIVYVLTSHHAYAIAAPLCIRTHNAPSTPCIVAQAAHTQAQQARGLMHRRTLKPNEGMLFFYNPPQPIYMWMKDTWIALDMLFLDSTRTIIHRELNATPHDRTPRGTSKPIAYVLEVPHGTAQRYHMELGTRLTWNAHTKETQ